MILGMKLLRFTVRNHRSLAGEVTFDLAPRLADKNRPKSGDWEEVVDHLAVIYGANAAGKSNLIDAIRFAQYAVAFSATRWQEENSIPHFPFKLSQEDNDAPSMFEFDFIADNDVRYLYGFELTRDGIVSEWLSSVKNASRSRWVKIYNRVINYNKPEKITQDVSWGNSIPLKTQSEFKLAGHKELFLSIARRSENRELWLVAKSLISEIVIISLGEDHVTSRIQAITKMVKNSMFDVEELSTLMRLADTGITKVEIDEKKIPQDLIDLFNKLKEVAVKNEKSDNKASPNLSDEEISELAYSLVFTHKGAEGVEKKLKFRDESSGTVAWLSLAPIILDALREGKVLLADELDTSLHQNLVEMIVQTFSNSAVNIHGAQLIFTSHNTNYLEQLKEFGISKNQVWFVDKDLTGVSDLISLGEFDTPTNANFEKRYLSGRYGGIPLIADGLFREMILNQTKGEGEDDGR